MNTVHKPVLVKEIIDHLAPKKNENFIDCTVGGGGHAEEILKLTGPKGKLLGLDWDSQAIERTKEHLADYKSRLVLVNDTYTNVKQVIYDKGFDSVNGVLLDLGLSSDQLQASGRGFTFQANEPLDMRFSLENDLTAADILNDWPKGKIIQILREYGEEKFAKRIAESIVARRKFGQIKTTLELVTAIVSTVPTFRGKPHPATKTFQALRIAVNDELENVKNALKDIVDVLEPGAKIAVITFHSLEDRIVKEFFRQESKDCHCPPEIPVCRCDHEATLKIITKKPISPSDEEVEENFRSRSAKLRVAERI